MKKKMTITIADEVYSLLMPQLEELFLPEDKRKTEYFRVDSEAEIHLNRYKVGYKIPKNRNFRTLKKLAKKLAQEIGAAYETAAKEQADALYKAWQESKGFCF